MSWAAALLALAAGEAAFAQMRPDWRKVGSSSVELALLQPPQARFNTSGFRWMESSFSLEPRRDGRM